MTTIPPQLKLEITKLYDGGLTMKQIAAETGHSIDAVCYFIRKHDIARRSLKASAKVRFVTKPPSFMVPQILNADQQALKLLGTSLYWAEGYKTQKSSGIDFANSDVAMLLIFLRFLREVCHVDESRIKVLLYTHDGTNLPMQMDYWSQLLSIPINNFSKPYIAKSDNRLDKNHKMPYGLVHVRYADKKLLWLVLDWIEEIKQNNCVGGGVVNRI